MKIANCRGPFWNTLGSSMYGANSLLMLALVSQTGTVEQAGAFGIAFTTAQLLYIIGLFGVPHYQMTDYREKYSFRDYTHLRIGSCALMLACCGGSLWILDFSGEKLVYTICLTLLMLLNVVGELYQCLFFQKGRLDLSGEALFHRTFWPLLAFAGLLFLSNSIQWALTGQIAVNLGITLYYARRIAPDFVSASVRGRAFPTTLLRECAPLFASLLLMNLLINASKYGVEFLLEEEAQGYYNMIFMPAQVINLCSQFLFKPLLNQYADALSHDLKKFRRLLLRQSILVGGLALAACLGAYWIGTPVLSLFYGQELSGLALPLTIVVLGGGIFAFCQLFYYILVILRKQKEIFVVYAGAMIACLPLTVWLVGWLGIPGAAISFAGIHLLILGAYFLLLAISLKRCGPIS